MLPPNTDAHVDSVAVKNGGAREDGRRSDERTSYFMRHSFRRLTLRASAL